ncbi:LysR family transcriptional regulator [Niallia sp. FSL W8-0635]|uniref:LysR family transcriptional regulator n=1 Tax=Niallia sp. FSL W8-0635 TaxID=2975337 RepID=UPI0009CEF5BA|nr:Putative transcriptional regulator, LysR family [Mycobacteroides abscessus subsp. abscessus]HEO8422429.1 LysR family transcriptional regulator [Yersinia enterocolitica]
MNIEQLKYIVEISNAGSLKTAAQKVNISLPALSQSVTKLEKELNVEIFHRSRKGSYPTAEGKVLIQKANDVLEKLQEFYDHAESFTHTLKGELKIATFPGPLDLLADQITLYKKDFPFIKASIEEDNSQHIIEKIKKEEVDIGLIIYNDEDIQKNKNILFHKLYDGCMVVAVNKQSPLANNTYITEKMLENQPIILYNDHSILDFMQNLNTLENNMEILFTTNNVETIRYALERNTAINIGYDYAFKTITGLANNNSYVTIPFVDTLMNTYYFGYIYAANKGISRVAKEFLKRLT